MQERLEDKREGCSKRRSGVDVEVEAECGWDEDWSIYDGGVPQKGPFHSNNEGWETDLMADPWFSSK